MARTYIYDVNGTQFEDVKAFGTAWANAKALAKEEHTTIKRTIVENNGKIIHEFYAKGGIFLDEKYYNVEDVKVF